MKNIILCEGSTDGMLLQYFMRKVHQWEDDSNCNSLFGSNATWFRTMKKGNGRLDIASCRGSSRLLANLNLALNFNYNAMLSEAYEKVAIVTDRDEIGTETDFIQALNNLLMNNNIKILDVVCHNEWIKCEYQTNNKKIRKMEILILIIPFAQTGAMETFLLESISNKDSYDAQIIQKGNQFVDNIDPQNKYLTKRRYITKAKFDVYFSVRTAAEQFSQRQNILKDVDWEKYIDVQGEFQKLAYLNC